MNTKENLIFSVQMYLKLNWVYIFKNLLTFLPAKIFPSKKISLFDEGNFY